MKLYLSIMQRNASDDDEFLLTEIASGNPRAFRRLFDGQYQKVYGYALRILRNESLAEEIVQEVFINIWLKRENLNEIGNFGAYLRVVTKNLTLNALKKIARDLKANSLGNVNWTEVDNDTESAILLKDTRALLQEAINQLPRQQRLVYELCQIEGLKQKQAALQLNISPLTIKVHLREANKTIRKFMTDKTELGLMLFLFTWFLK